MRKLIGILIGISLISHQLHCCVAFDLLGVTSSVVGLGQLVYEIMKGLLTPSGQIVDHALVAIKELNKDLRNDMTIVIDMLKDIPSVVRYQIKVNALESHFRTIERIFIEVIRIKKDVHADRIDRNNSVYEKLGSQLKDLDESMYEIRETLSDGNTTFILAQRFSTNLLKFENVCKIRMSNVQLLDELLGNLKMITAQYYLASKFIYEFLELKGEDNTNPIRRLNESVNVDYSQAVERFKGIMSNASLELWKCDPSEGYNDEIRFTDKTDPNFAELRIMSKYIVNEKQISSEPGQTCRETRCNAIKEIRSCPTWGSNLCKQVRLCPGKLIGCQKFYDRHLRVCKNDDKNAHHRYLSVVERNEPAENFHCDTPNSEVAANAVVFEPTAFPNVFPLGDYHDATCYQCNCLCEETVKYYVDGQSAHADSDKVVTGAKLLVERNILRIQIEQAKLLANGSIDRSTHGWKPLEPVKEDRLSRISIDELKQFVLTPIVRPDDEVVTGLGFLPSAWARAIYLTVHTRKFDFRTGTFIKESTDNEGRNPRKGYDMSGRDAPTKARLENKPDSTDDQYVELSLTSLDKDGGQSVIPFIDTQKVSANGPLSGAGLYIRGQPGFGGFLGIKLFTFDIRNYVDPWSGL